MDILFANVTAVTMDEDLRVLFSAFVGEIGRASCRERV